MATLRASAKMDGVNVKSMDTGSIFATLKTGWEVDGDMSTARTDLINIRVYRKGAGMPDIPLAKSCKCTLTGLNTPVPITVTPPPVDPPPPVTVDEFINIRKFAADRITVLSSEWYQKVVE
jgi:hypothetical protein